MSVIKSSLRPVAALLGFAALIAGILALTAGTAQASTHPATRVKILRAVTTTGHAARGWRVVTDHRRTVACDERSYVALEAGIDFCGGSGDDTEACWKSATPGRVLCTSPYQAMRKTLVSIRLDGSFGDKPREGIQPIAMRLRNGMTMYARDGGAWSPLRQHPTWVGWYYQELPTPHIHTVYGPRHSDGGINHSRPAWFVKVYASPQRNGYDAYVENAYFVGTAH